MSRVHIANRVLIYQNIETVYSAIAACFIFLVIPTDKSNLYVICANLIVSN